MNFLSLIWLIFLPVIAAIVIMLPVFPNHQVRIRRFAKWFAGLHFVYALLFLLFFDTSMYGMSFEKELTFFGMSWLKTNVMLSVNESDAVIADLMTDGCNMGVKSLSRYLNEYKAADEKSKEIAKKIIESESALAGELRAFL